MGLAIKGKKVIGLALNGKKLLGEVKNGKVIWRFFIARKLWESDKSGTLQNIQIDDKGLVYAIDDTNINRINKNNGTVNATKHDTAGFIGDLTFNTSQGYINYFGKTAYWNALNYSNLQGVNSGQKSNKDYPVDVVGSKYVVNNYQVSIAACQSGYVSILNNSSTSGYTQSGTWDAGIGNPFYLFTLDRMGTGSTFNIGDFIAYNSSGSKAYNASSSIALTLTGKSDIFKNSGKITISPIGTGGTEDFYLLQTPSYNELFSISKSSSTVNVKHLTYFSPLSTNEKVTALAIDYDNYGKYLSKSTMHLMQLDHKFAWLMLPYKFTAYDSELGTDGQEHVYALNYNSSGNNDWKNVSHEKIIDIDKGCSVSQMIKKGDNLYIGENYSIGKDYSSTPWKFTADTTVLSVAVDSSGNVYAGTDGHSVYKLDASGKQIWKFTADSDVNSVAVDSSGNVYAGTDSNSVYKLDASGNQIWKFTADNYVMSVAVDSSGNVYAGTYGDYVYKLNTSGKQIWKFTADSDVDSVAVDSSGNVYAGTYGDSVYKLNTSGNQVWQFNAHDTVNSVAVDSSGNVYAGTDSNSVYKLTPDGSNTTTYNRHKVYNRYKVENYQFLH